jgi:dnd system-associated protein 4
MAEIRIKIAKDKAKLVKALRAGDGSTGLFQTYYEILVFAATLGAKRGKFIPIKEGDFSKEIDPIRQEQFASKGYDQAINLLAVIHNRDPKVLGNAQDAEEKRIEVFEGYANGGLELLQDALIGSNDHTKQIMLMLVTEHKKILMQEDISDDLDSIFNAF